MLIIQHRVNTIEQLLQTPHQYGVELDIRDKYDGLILQHDAFLPGENFTTYLQNYRHGFCIANIKAEGIEEQVIRDFEKHYIDNYFLLDVSLPFLVKLSKKGFKKLAVRFSIYEPKELALSFAGKVDWIWVDCFDGAPIHPDHFLLLKKHFRVCLVSPELHGYPVENINDFKTSLKSCNIDAVCTKRPDLWLM